MFHQFQTFFSCKRMFHSENVSPVSSLLYENGFTRATDLEDSEGLSDFDCLEVHLPPLICAPHPPVRAEFRLVHASALAYRSSSGKEW